MTCYSNETAMVNACYPLTGPLSHSFSDCLLTITNGDTVDVAVFDVPTLHYWEDPVGNVTLQDATQFLVLTPSQMTDASLTTGNLDTYMSNCDTAGGGGAIQLVNLSDVIDATPTDMNLLFGTGTLFASRPMEVADISDFGDYAEVGHTHTMAQVTDAGALATLNVVDTTEIDNDAVTSDKMDETGVTAGAYGDVTITVNAEGRVTDISSGGAAQILEDPSKFANHYINTLPLSCAGINRDGLFCNANSITTPPVAFYTYTKPDWYQLFPGDTYDFTAIAPEDGSFHAPGTLLLDNGVLSIVVGDDSYNFVNSAAYDPADDDQLELLVGRTLHLDDSGRFSPYAGTNKIPVAHISSTTQLRVLDPSPASPYTTLLNESLVAHWRFGKMGHNNTQTEVLDLSGNGNNLTVNNGTPEHNSSNRYTRYGYNNVYAEAQVDAFNAQTSNSP